MAEHAIEILDSDDEAPDSAPAPTTTGANSSEAIELLSDDEDEVPPVATAQAPAATSSSSGANSSQAIELLDDDDAGEAAAAQSKRQRRAEPPACFLCESARLSNPYTLSECSHRFCRACLTTHVEKRLRRVLASEVVCPKCKKQLSISDVQALSGAAQRGDAAPPPSSGLGGVPAHMVAMLQARGMLPPGFVASSARGGGGGGSSSSGPVGGRREGTSVATKRLMKELQAIRGSGDAQGFSVSVPDESDLYTWDAQFFGFDKGSPLAKDLAKVPGGKIELRLSFPSQYPSAPPYVRVIRPRFQFRTGHVTIGGSICTEMLTSVGWSSTMTVESVLVGIRANMLVGGARLDLRIKQDYSEAEAQEAFNRMVREHGWY